MAIEPVTHRPKYLYIPSTTHPEESKSSAALGTELQSGKTDLSEVKFALTGPTMTSGETNRLHLVCQLDTPFLSTVEPDQKRREMRRLAPTARLTKATRGPRGGRCSKLSKVASQH